MIELRRLNLEEKKDMDLFNAMSEEYYTDVCTPDELSQEIADLYDDELNAELIEQTKRKKLHTQQEKKLLQRCLMHWN